jgi:hypothetical protein
MTQPFGAFFQCYKNSYATYKCLESFRRHYPDNTIVLLSDNGNNYSKMAEYFNCIYIHSYENVSLRNTDLNDNKYIDNVHKIIERFKKAFLLIKEDYIMWLEDDVSINGKISDTFKYDINGFCPNMYNEKMINELSKTYDCIKIGQIYRWCGQGGSIFNKSNILKYFENKDIINDVLIHWKKYNLPEDICHDFFISLLVNTNCGTIGTYKGHQDRYKRLYSNIPVQHQYKVWYNIPLPPELQHLVSS